MKIQCNACEAAEATVLCCADEAALCGACDEKIHAANKLASKHQRVPLSNSSSQMPKCDICQETTGYFFCLEDRALLCRKCDVAIHTANSYVSTHRRFLLTGVKVGLEPSEPVVSSSKEKLNPTERRAQTPFGPLSTTGNSMSLCGETNRLLSSQRGEDVGPPEARLLSSQRGEDVGPPEARLLSSQRGEGRGPPEAKVIFSGGTVPTIIPDWAFEDFLGLNDFEQDYGFVENGSSKGDNTKLGSSEWSPIYRAAGDEELHIDECLGQPPESQWKVPEVPSPPTASGLYWPRNIEHLSCDSPVFVPDVCASLSNLHGCQLDLPLSKRCRQA